MRRGWLEERYLWMTVGYALLLAIGLALVSDHPVSWLLVIASVTGVGAWAWRSRA